MRKVAILICLCCASVLTRAQWSHATFAGGSINYKGYQTGIGYMAEKQGHMLSFSVLKNQSVDRLFAGNHMAISMSYGYNLSSKTALSFGPELDIQKMWFSKVGNRYNDSRTVSIAYFMRWNINEHFALSNSLGIGGYVERFYYQHEEKPEKFKGVGGLIKLNLFYTF